MQIFQPGADPKKSPSGVRIEGFFSPSQYTENRSSLRASRSPGSDGNSLRLPDTLSGRGLPGLISRLGTSFPISGRILMEVMTPAPFLLKRAIVSPGPMVILPFAVVPASPSTPADRVRCPRIWSAFLSNSFSLSPNPAWKEGSSTGSVKVVTENCATAPNHRLPLSCKSGYREQGS